MGWSTPRGSDNRWIRRQGANSGNAIAHKLRHVIAVQLRNGLEIGSDGIVSGAIAPLGQDKTDNAQRHDDDKQYEQELGNGNANFKSIHVTPP